MRLKRSIELFTAADGCLYLLRLGAGDDQVLEEPSNLERQLLTRLAAGLVNEQELIADLGGGVSELLAQLHEFGLLEVRDQPRRLSSPQAERFDRQLIYLADLAPPKVSAEDLQLCLGRARVLMLGCGGLGSWAACGLSLSGVGSLVLVDDDRVELSNLSRQLLFDSADLGRSKVDAAAERLKRHNPGLSVETHRVRIRSPEDLEELLDDQVSLIISTADWPADALPRWVNQAASRRGTPWLSAGQFPPRLRIGPLIVPGQTACFECLESWARQESPLYDEVAGFRGQRQTPDSSTGPVSGVIGSLLANEAIHYLVEREPASHGRVLLFDLQTMTIQQQPIEADPRCLVCASAGKVADDQIMATEPG